MKKCAKFYDANYRDYRDRYVSDGCNKCANFKPSELKHEDSAREIIDNACSLIQVLTRFDEDSDDPFTRNDLAYCMESLALSLEDEFRYLSEKYPDFERMIYDSQESLKKLCSDRR